MQPPGQAPVPARVPAGTMLLECAAALQGPTGWTKQAVEGMLSGVVYDPGATSPRGIDVGSTPPPPPPGGSDNSSSSNSLPPPPPGSFDSSSSPPPPATPAGDSMDGAGGGLPPPLAPAGAPTNLVRSAASQGLAWEPPSGLLLLLAALAAALL